MTTKVTKLPKQLRYTIFVDYEDTAGWRGHHVRWENTKNRAFLSAAVLIGMVRAGGGSDMKVEIVDSQSGQNIHKVCDDLYWLY